MMVRMMARRRMGTMVRKMLRKMVRMMLRNMVVVLRIMIVGIVKG